MQLIPFDSNKLPAHIKPKSKVANLFAAALGGGFPVISIKGKVFHIVKGDEKTLVTQPDDDESPASSLEVVIVGVNPNKAKVFYLKGFEEGSIAKPDCYSNDGVAPAADAQTPQAKKCATCAQNQWGSKITENSKQGKACADHMRLAVTPAGQLNDPMLLRVPAASLKMLGIYGETLSKRGVEPHQVVTKVGFDYTVAHPALTFKAIGFVTDAMMAEIAETQQSAVVAQILGTAPVEGAPEAFEQAAPEPAPAPAAEPDKPKRVKKAATLVQAEEEAATTPAAKVNVEEDEETVAPVKVASGARPLEEELADLEFDD